VQLHRVHRDDDFKVELEKQWKRFVEKELPTIVAAIDEASWIHDKDSLKAQ
jgi:hypothetical protein